MKRTVISTAIILLLLLLLGDAYAIDLSNASTSHYSNEGGSLGFGTTGSFCDPNGVFDLPGKQFSHSSVAVTKAVIPFIVSYKAIEVEDRISIPFTVSTSGNYDIDLPVWVTGSVASVGATAILPGAAWGDCLIYFDSDIYDSSGEIISGSIGSRNEICNYEKGLAGLLGETAFWGIVDVLTLGSGTWVTITVETAEAFNTIWDTAESLGNPLCEWNNEPYLCSASSYLNPGQYEFRVSLFSEVQSNTVAAGAGGHLIRADLDVSLGDIISNISIPTEGPNPPSNLSFPYASSTRVDLTWTDNSDNEAGFNIYAVGDQTLYEPWQVEYLIGTVGQNATTFTDTNPYQYSEIIPTCRTKKYVVYSYNSLGESRDPLQSYWSAVIIPPVSEPLNLQAEVLGHDSIKLTWENGPNNEATQFYILRSPVPISNGANLTPVAVVDVSDEEYIHNGLTADTRYYYILYPMIGQTYYPNIYAFVDAKTDIVTAGNIGVAIRYDGTDLVFSQEGPNEYRSSTLDLGTFEQFGLASPDFSIQNLSSGDIGWRYDISGSDKIEYGYGVINSTIPIDGSCDFYFFINKDDVGQIEGELSVLWHPSGSSDYTQMIIPITCEIIPRQGEGPRIVGLGIPASGVIDRGTSTYFYLGIDFDKPMDISLMAWKIEDSVELKKNDGTSIPLAPGSGAFWSTDLKRTNVFFYWADVPTSTYTLTINDDFVKDETGEYLDGEWYGDMPSGDGQQGGDFEYAFSVINMQTVSTPGISPHGGTFTGSTQVTLSCSTAAPRTIYYTTDGTTPTTSSYLYTEPFTISSSCTVWARAFKSDYYDSSVAKASFTITPPPPVYTLEVYSSGVPGPVSISSSTEHGGITDYGIIGLVSGTSVTLTTPSTVDGKTFTGWTGSVMSSNQNITFPMNDNKMVTANFTTPRTGPNIYVDGVNGDDLLGTGTEADAYKTVQKALEVASNGDKIIILAGTYPENITMNKQVTIEAQNGLVIIGQ